MVHIRGVDIGVRLANQRDDVFLIEHLTHVARACFERRAVILDSLQLIHHVREVLGIKSGAETHFKQFRVHGDKTLVCLDVRGLATPNRVLVAPQFGDIVGEFGDQVDKICVVHCN